MFLSSLAPCLSHLQKHVIYDLISYCFRVSIRKMCDNGIWDLVKRCEPPASVCFSWSMYKVGRQKCCTFPRHSLIPLGQAVWSSHDQSNMSNCQCFPPTYNKKIWIQLLLHPKGNFQNSSPPHLSEKKLSRFLRSSEICLLILNHTSFHRL